jgi:hypothetical protein
MLLVPKHEALFQLAIDRQTTIHTTTSQLFPTHYKHTQHTTHQIYQYSTIIQHALLCRLH